MSERIFARRLQKGGAGVALASLIFTGACSSEHGPKITTGQVISHKDTPAHDWLYMQPIPHTMCVPISTGKFTSEECTTTFTYIPIEEHDPEKWSITIQNCDIRDKKDNCATRTLGVSQQTYEETPLGSTYTVPTPSK